MRVVDLNTFLRMPVGTIYSKGGMCFFDGLFVKGETLSSMRDWYAIDLITHDCTSSTEFSDIFTNGQSYPINEWPARDGLFDDDALFLIYELDDLKVLREFIADAENVAPTGSIQHLQTSVQTKD